MFGIVLAKKLGLVSGHVYLHLLICSTVELISVWFARMILKALDIFVLISRSSS